MTIAYCWRNGELGFTDDSLPHGAIIIDKGTGIKWKGNIEVLCRLSYSGAAYLIPGIPEAYDDEEALLALYTFQASLEWTQLPKKQRDKISWAKYVEEKMTIKGKRKCKVYKIKRK